MEYTHIDTVLDIVEADMILLGRCNEFTEENIKKMFNISRESIKDRIIHNENPETVITVSEENSNKN